MLAARDQENLVHAHQQAAAGKPLNQTLRQLQPKTPGNRTQKTPFKVPLNDENAVFAQKNTLKGIGKGNENFLQTIKKDGKLDKSAFVTPMGPRTNRAPLGMKTTNAKARAFETPAATQGKPLQTIKKGSTAGAKKKSKITIAQPEPTLTDILAKEDEDDVPDVEYMPPKPVELADPPEEIPYDDTFPQFQGKNMFKGWAQLYGPPVGSDGLTDAQREQERRYTKLGEEAQRKLDAQINDNTPMLDAELEADREVERLIQSHYAGPKKELDTVKARGAASALSSSSKPLSQLTKPTLASQKRAKVPSKILPTSKKSTPQPTNPSSMRHTALAAASKNTVGYSKGRNVSSKLSNITSHFDSPQKASKAENDNQRDMSPRTFRTLFGEPPVGSAMWYRLHDNDMFGTRQNIVDDLEDDFASMSLGSTAVMEEQDDDDEVFQLKWT